jgi:hypothetical protein
MSRFLASALGVAVLLGALSSLGVAGQPDPNQSTWGNLVGCSPKNLTAPAAARYAFVGTLRDGAGAPIGNFPAASLELDFGSCTNPSTRPQNQIAADGPSDANGVVRWQTALTFGGADPCEVRVLVQNVVFKTLAAHQGLPNASIDGGLRSVDENGNGTVDLPDLSLFQQEFVNTGTRADWRGDLGPTFDGLTALPDLSTFQQHFTAP